MNFNTQRLRRRPGVFGAQSIANTSHLLRRTARRLGSLAPAVRVANTPDSFRGEGWDEGQILSPHRGRLFPSPHLSPQSIVGDFQPHSGERDQRLGLLA
jgi:hypothetical protein